MPPRPQQADRTEERAMTPVREWYTAAELAALDLKDMPDTVRGVNLMAEREGWPKDENSPLSRKREGRGGGWEYHFNLLPMRAQRQLIATETAARIEREKQAAPTAAKADMTRNERSAWFASLPEKKKLEAERRAEVLDAVNMLYRGGITKNLAVAEMAKQTGKSSATIYNWLRSVSGLDRADWEPALARKHGGGAKRAECDPAVWDFVKSDQLRPSANSFATTYRDAVLMAEQDNVAVPSYDALKKRFEREMPPEVVALGRGGKDACDQYWPWQERERKGFYALEAINVDGHVLDTLVKWPKADGSGYTVLRPTLIAIQDLYSGKMLAWRLHVEETSHGFRLAFGDVLRQYGIPKKIWMDNGLAWAAKDISGGAPTRYRFKKTEGERTGLLVRFGLDIHFTKPRHGQSKPIERGFRDLTDSISRHRLLEGSYTGNSPENKPSNYGEKPAELDLLLRVIDARMKEHNSRPGRRTPVCRGRSFDEVFWQSYHEAAGAGLIARATEEQIRQCLLAGESITCNRRDGTLRLFGNRYWSEALNRYRGQKLQVRYDPDALHSCVEVYQNNGAYIGQAECWHPVGFEDKAAAKEYAARRRRFHQVTKERLELETELNHHPGPPLPPADTLDPPQPAPKVVRMFRPGPPVARPAAQADTGGFSAEEVDRFMTLGLKKFNNSSSD